jgi:hypothetical protein
MRHRSAFASTAAFAIILSAAVATSSDRDRITLGDLASISATREPSRLDVPFGHLPQEFRD